jgi:hypothetical protein
MGVLLKKLIASATTVLNSTDRKQCRLRSNLAVTVLLHSDPGCESLTMAEVRSHLNGYDRL